jgi:FKBP-type peptidyl-prolyl cis-trans isomerase FkpA
MRFVIPAALAACLLAAACIDSIDVPECHPMTLTVASTQGDTVTTNTGLRYIDLAVGTGTSTDWCHNVAVEYQAYLPDGTQFDASPATTPLLFAPGLGSLIDGFEQGVIGMKAGGSRRLIIPPEIGFGPEGRKDASGQVIVPGNSIVIYDIGMIQVAP